MTSTCQLLLWYQLRWSLGSFGRYGRPGTYFFEDKSISVQNCIRKAVLAAKGWEEALQPVPNLASMQTPLMAGDNLRFPNCFVDGAWQDSSLLAGRGWTLTCSASAPTIKDSSFRSNVGSALTAEVLAFEKPWWPSRSPSKRTEGECNHSPHLLKLNGLSLYHVLRDRSEWNRGRLIRYSKLYVFLLVSIFKFISSSANIVADVLAKAALVCLTVVSHLLQE